MGASNADYERQFKEIVAKAKAAYGTGAYDDSTLEFLIPELRESEDDKVIRTLYHLVKDHDWLNGATKDEVLAWLEKQKEEEGYEAIPVESTLEYKLGFKAGKDSEKQKEQKHPNGCFTCDEYKKGYEAGRLNGFTAGYNKAMKEQKPAQTDDEKEYIRTLKSLISDFIRDKQPEDVAYYQRVYDWLEERHVEQKPAEWNEEDEEAIKMCLDAIPKRWKTKSGILLTEWLKEHLRPQPKQEWSEEDEEMLDLVIGDVTDAKKNFVSKDAKDCCDREIAWLKSLRPSWKPSEEEERLINTSISFLKDFADKGYENAVECIDWLKSKLNGNTCK